MKGKLDRSDYLKNETEFLLRTIDLREVIQDHKYKFNRGSSSPKQPVYTRGDRVITVTMGSKKGIWIWCDLANRTSSGTLTEFLMMEYMCDKKGAYDKMREIANDKYGVDYQMFKDGFSKSQGSIKKKSEPRASEQDKARTNSFNYE